MQGIPISSIDLSWICFTKAAVPSLESDTSLRRFRIDPTLYSPMIFSSLAGSISGIVSFVMVSMESCTIWPAFSLRDIFLRTDSTFASTCWSEGMAGLTFPPLEHDDKTALAIATTVNVFFKLFISKLLLLIHKGNRDLRRRDSGS